MLTTVIALRTQRISAYSALNGSLNAGTAEVRRNRREILCSKLVFRYHSTRVTSHPEGVTQMSFSARSLPAVLLTILSIPISLWAQAAPKQQPTKAPRGSISGRVTIKEKPAIGVVVSIRKGEQRDPFEGGLRGTTAQERT